MASLEEIRQARLAKLRLLEEKGIDAYPASARQDYTLKDVAEKFDALAASGESISLVGRILSIRGQGKIAFFTFSDGTGHFQALLKYGEPTPAETFELFQAAFDNGDFVEARGTLFISKAGEKTILAEDVRMLSKSLRPLPEKWSGLQDIEERFRRRYLDLISNEGVKERFETRSRIITLIREFYDNAGFIEVDLPNLQPLAGGATAAPFVTHHNALDMDFYLPVAQELYIKMLLAGGMLKVYELGKRFRNEGIDTTHNPEFTMLESNEAYADAASQREFIEELFKFLVRGIFGHLQFEYNGETISLEGPFAITTYYDLLRNNGLSNPEGRDAKELDEFYKKEVRPGLIQPTFIIDYPVSANPFAKRKADDPTLIDRFQLCIGGVELVNAFSELNNPIDQLERYQAEDKRGAKGDKEISPSDLEYLEAMEYGMPPNGGIGIGIDRLVMLLTNVSNIKEVILFPTLKPRE